MSFACHLYVIVEDGPEAGAAFKVGTARNVAYRISGLRAGNWRPLKLIYTRAFISDREAFHAEGRVQAKFAAQRLAGRDWFMGNPEEAVAFIRGME